MRPALFTRVLYVYHPRAAASVARMTTVIREEHSEATSEATTSKTVQPLLCVGLIDDVGVAGDGLVVSGKKLAGPQDYNLQSSSDIVTGVMGPDYVWRISPGFLTIIEERIRVTRDQTGKATTVLRGAEAL